jgi:hypothetical protein
MEVKMDWSQQIEDMMKSWMDAQQGLWDSYFNGMQNVGKSQSAQIWESTISTGEELWKNFFKSQEDWISNWVQSLEAMDGVPKQVLDSAHRFQEMSQQWNKTQIGLIQNWFTMLKNFIPTSPGDVWSEFPKSMLNSWQDTTQMIMDAQMKWMNSWVGKTEETKDE